MKAIIVGGGIGGLTTALMLRARGIGCELFEQSDSIRELGVGINTLPHAIRELAGLGLLQKLDDIAIRTEPLLDGAMDDTLEAASVDRELRHVVAGVDAAGLAPDFLAVTVEVVQHVGADRDVVELLQ